MEKAIIKELERYGELTRRRAGLSKVRKAYGRSASEMAVIDIIGRMEGPAVTVIAEKLGMTRGAISKITQKLMGEGLIESYRLPDNRQKVFFRLKKEGQLLFEEYTTLRDKSLSSDEAFFTQYSEKKLRKIEKFLREYNAYLEETLQK